MIQSDDGTVVYDVIVTVLVPSLDDLVLQKTILLKTQSARMYFSTGQKPIKIPRGKMSVPVGMAKAWINHRSRR